MRSHPDLTFSLPKVPTCPPTPVSRYYLPVGMCTKPRTESDLLRPAYLLNQVLPIRKCSVTYGVVTSIEWKTENCPKGKDQRGRGINAIN